MRLANGDGPNIGQFAFLISATLLAWFSWTCFQLVERRFQAINVTMICSLGVSRAVT